MLTHRPAPSLRFGILAAVSLLGMACSGSGAEYGGSTGSSGASPGTMGEGGASSSSGAQASGGVEAGTLTAGAWDDNRNFDVLLDFLQQQRDGHLEGLPAVPIDRRHVVKVVSDDGRPVGGARVTILENGIERAVRHTNAEGTVYVLPEWDGVSRDDALTARISRGSQEISGALSMQQDSTFTLTSPEMSDITQLDLAFVIDTTGSMGDEMQYIAAEFDGIVASVGARFPGVNQRFALILFRDDGDDYQVRTFDFTADAGAFRADLGRQEAGGGGDWPELPDLGLQAASNLSWRGEGTARLLFLVADAPHHVENEGRFTSSVRALRERGVMIHPVAASGADSLVEISMRLAAAATGGRYLFLTDDSGVGNTHSEPTIPCYFVTSLQKQMIRMVTMAISGIHEEPAADDIIRTGGDPTDGHCTLEGGQVVNVL